MTPPAPDDLDWLDTATDRLLASGRSALPALRAERPELAEEVDRIADALAGVRGAMSARRVALDGFSGLASIGVGAMGRVLLGSERALYGRPVAIKVLHAHLLGAEDARTRLRREVIALARIDHRGILPVLGTVLDDHGALVGYSMPLVRGCSLAEIMARREDAGGAAADGNAMVLVRRAVAEAAMRIDRLAANDVSPVHATPEEARSGIGDESDRPTGDDVGDELGDEPGGGVLEAADWSAFVCRVGSLVGRALAAAHAAGLTHRDVKPSNILVDVSGRVRLTDFGLVIDRQDALRSRLTVVDQFIGTEAYAAPEQREPTADEVVGPAADVYALGATLEHAISGRRATTTMPVPPAGSLTRRSRSSEGSSRRRSRDLRTLITVATETKPAHRYPSMTAMADDLDRILRDEPVLARPVPVSRRTGRWVRRHRGQCVGFSLAVSITALLGLAANWYLAIAPRQGADLERAAVRAIVVDSTAEVLQSAALRLPRERRLMTDPAGPPIATGPLAAALREGRRRLAPALRFGRSSPWREDLFVVLEIASAVVSVPPQPFDIPPAFQERRPGTAAYAREIGLRQAGTSRLFTVPLSRGGRIQATFSGNQDRELGAALAFMILDFEAAEVLWSRAEGRANGSPVTWALRALAASLRGESIETARWANRARLAGLETPLLWAVELEAVFDLVTETEFRQPAASAIQGSRRAWAFSLRNGRSRPAEDEWTAASRRVDRLISLLELLPGGDPTGWLSPGEQEEPGPSGAAAMASYRGIDEGTDDPRLVEDAAFVLEALDGPAAALGALRVAQAGRLGDEPTIDALILDLADRVDDATALGVTPAERDALVARAQRERDAFLEASDSPGHFAARLSRVAARRQWLAAVLTPEDARPILPSIPLPAGDD